MFETTQQERLELGRLRARDVMFDAIFALWKIREAEGLTQKDLCDILEKDPAWLSRTLAGPSNWTIKTAGELTEALNGILFVTAVAAEKHKSTDNYDIYDHWTSSCVEMTNLPAQVTSRAGGLNISIDVPPASGNVVSTTKTTKTLDGLGLFVSFPSSVY